MKNINYFYVYVYVYAYLLIIYIYIYIYKELKLTKLDFHITSNSSLVSSSTIEGKKKRKKKCITLEFYIYKELELGKFEYCVPWNSSLLNLNSMWHFSIKKSTSTKFFFFMKLEHLKLDLHNKLEFQKVVYC